MERLRRSPAVVLIALYAIFEGVMYLRFLATLLLHPEEAQAMMLQLPFGRFEWGLVWANTAVAAPMVLLGGLLLFSRDATTQRLGRFLAFGGFTVNVYAVVMLWFGFRAMNRPWSGMPLWENVALTALGVLAMIYLAAESPRSLKTKRYE
jgi:hypothetical protein